MTYLLGLLPLVLAPINLLLAITAHVLLASLLFNYEYIQKVGIAGICSAPRNRNIDGSLLVLWFVGWPAILWNFPPETLHWRRVSRRYWTVDVKA